MLWGTLAAGLPVLIHLAGRTKPVVHRFPAMRFLQRSQRASSRALRLKHLLLLLLRAAVIALLAITFARPLWPWSSAAAAGTLLGDIVFVVDASLSMQTQGVEQVRFEAARLAALKAMDRLADEARVALIRAGEEPDAVQGRLTLDHETVRLQLEEMAVTAEALDVGRSLDAARRVLERDKSGRTQAVVFVTDLQASGFERLARRVQGEKEKEKHPGLIVVDVGEEDARNGAVLSLRLPGSTVPSNDTVRLNARVRPLNPERACPVDLYLDGVKVGQQMVDPGDSTEVAVAFSFPAGKPGLHTGWLELAHADGLMADQRRYFAYRAGRPPRVLLVGRRVGPDDRGSGFFLKAALSSKSATVATGLVLEETTPEALDGEKLADQRCVILADCGDLTEGQWRSLSRFVEQGGGLFFWFGPRTDPKNVRSHDFSEVARHHGLLPGKIAGRAVLATPGAIRVATPDHPLLAGFPSSVSAEWSEVLVRSLVRITPDPRDKSVTVLLKAGEGAPLLLDNTYGQGRVFLSAIDPGDADSDLVKHGEVFLTLVLEACRLLAHEELQAAVEVGRVLTRKLAEPPRSGTVQWTRPGSDRSLLIPLEVSPDEELDEDTPRNRLITPRLAQPGLHRFAWQPRTGANREWVYAVNVPAKEADPRRVESEQIPKMFDPWPVSLVRDIDEAPLFQTESTGRREFPALMLLLVLALMMAEAFLANRMYPSSAPEAESSELPAEATGESPAAPAQNDQGT